MRSKPTKKRLVLINPNVEELCYFYAGESKGVVEPLWAGIIAALTPEEEWDVQFIHEGMKKLDFGPADLVGITTFSVNAERAYRIAAIYRAKGIPVVIGGVHASIVPEEAAQYCDAVVVGDAEETWPQLLEDLRNGGLKPFYRAGAPHGELQTRTRRDIFRGYMSAAVQFSRGCSGTCAFCSIPALERKGIRYRSIDVVLDDIASIRKRYFFFVDDNLTGMGPKQNERALELFKAMVKRGLRKRFIAEASINLYENDELLYWMNRAGCFMCLIGFEDIDADRLAGLNKRHNLRVDYRKAIQTFHRHNMSIYGSFIIGLPGQTPDDVRATIDFCVEAGVDYPFLSLASLLPGSKWWERYIDQVPFGRDLPRRYANLCGSYLPVVPNPSFPVEEWPRVFREAARKLSNWGRVSSIFMRWARRGDFDNAFSLLGMGRGLKVFYSRLARSGDVIDPETGRFRLKSRLTPLPELAAPSGMDVSSSLET